MKKTTKIILKLLSFAIVFMLFSCEKDLYEDPIRNASKIKIEKFSVKNISTERTVNPSELLKSISKTKAKFKLSNNKIVYDSINNFYFDDENGYKMSEDDKESYTFQLHRNQENELSKIENIIFSLNKEGFYDAFISKYIYSENEIKNKTIAELENSEVIYTPIYSDKMTLICLDVITVYSGCTETHSNGETCSNTTTTTTLWCGWLDDGGGGSSGGGGGGSGGGSSSSGGSGGSSEGGGGSGGGSSSGSGGSSSSSNSDSIELPIMTMPVHGIQPVNHIAKLNEITAIPDTGKPQNVFRNKIFQYIYGLDNASNENGVEYRRGATTNGVPSYYPVNPIATGYDYTAFGNPALNTVLYIHFHHNHSQTNSTGNEKALSPVFSDGDFTQFAKSYKQLTDLNSPERKNFTSLMVSQNGLYAMRVGDAEQLLAFNDWLSDPVNKKTFIGKFSASVINKAKTKAAEIFNAQGGGTQAQLDAITAQQFEKWFIRFIQNFNEENGNMGIYFFKGTIHQGQVTWTQIAN